MNADALRAAQAPLKARYEDDPSAAKLTLHARGRVEQGRCALKTPPRIEAHIESP